MQNNYNETIFYPISFKLFKSSGIKEVEVILQEANKSLKSIYNLF